MKVEFFVGLEPVSDRQTVAWWATSSSIGNLAVAAASLRELEALAREAVDEAVDESGLGPVEVTFTLINDAPPSAGDDLPSQRPSAPDTVGVHGQRTARELVSAA